VNPGRKGRRGRHTLLQMGQGALWAHQRVAVPKGGHLLDLAGLVRFSRPHDENQRPARRGDALPVELQGDEVRQLNVHAFAAT